LPAGLLELRQAESTEVVDRTGELLYEARNADGGRTSWLTPDQLPQPLVDATLAAEDRRFFTHAGIDPIAVARATARNVRHRRWLEGGSTITQQVVKNFLLTSEKSIERKIKEAILAHRLEHRRKYLIAVDQCGDLVAGKNARLNQAAHRTHELQVADGVAVLDLVLDSLAVKVGATGCGQAEEQWNEAIEK
jgi:hypothetical protein